MKADNTPSVASNALLAADMCRMAQAFDNARAWLMRAHFFSVRSSLHKTSKEIAETIKDLEKAEKQLRDFTANARLDRHAKEGPEK